MQANGAEMLRLAIIFMVKDGIEVCAPVHDAVLIEAPIEELDEKVKRAQNLMAKASRLVLKDFELKTDAELIQYPGRFSDPERGQVFWGTVMRLLKKAKVNKVSQI